MEASQVDLVGVGLNAADTLISVPQFPEPGSKATVRSLASQLGGQVATAVIACQRWGLRTRYIGKLGDDSAAASHLQAFAAAGVETQIATVPGCASAQSHILVDDSGERSVLWHRDPRLALTAADVKREWIVNARALLIAGCAMGAYGGHSGCRRPRRRLSGGRSPDGKYRLPDRKPGLSGANFR